MSIRQQLHQVDPYVGFDPALHPSQPRGWNNHTEHFRALASHAIGGRSEAPVVIEVGSWLGNSALHLAEVFPKAEIVCVDTWLGAREMWENHADGDRYQALKLRSGYPSIYYDFMANIMRAGKQHQVTPMPMASGVAAEWFKRNLKQQPALIYIDGSHSYKDVCRDIEDYLELFPRVLCGDDFHDWPDVRKAVEEKLRAYNFTVSPTGLWAVTL